MSQLNRKVYFVGKGTNVRTIVGTVEDEVSIIGDHCKLMIQRIRHTPQQASAAGSTVAYRSCYYSYTADMKRIVFGQYAQCVSKPEFQDLLKQARAKGWPL
jgi:hypothetical protein